MDSGGVPGVAKLAYAGVEDGGEGGGVPCAGAQLAQRQLHCLPSGVPSSLHHWQSLLGWSVPPSHGPLP